MDTFYFESEHAAFRGDPDYNNVLRYLTIRFKQRACLKKHIEELMSLQKEYTDNPEKLLQKLHSNEQIIPTHCPTEEMLPLVITKLNELNEDVISNTEPLIDSTIKRSRLPDDNTAGTCNRLWTFEEQRRLEELLIKYPPEPIEMHRFTKIARDLGNRTPLQVSSRVQKYFQRLYKAGLPIPGRIPKNRRNQTKTKSFNRSSTFFPAYNVPVKIPDDDLFANSETISSIKSKTMQIFETKPSHSKLEHARVLELLKLVRDKCKESRKGGTLNPCEICYLSPEHNFHWHCYECNWRQMLCSECIIKKLLSYNFEHILHNVVIDN